MGCSMPVSEEAIAHIPIAMEIPCSPQEIGKSLNQVRANPLHFADLIQGELKKFTDEYSVQISSKAIYRTNQGKSVYRQAIQFLRKQQPLPPLQLHQGLCKASNVHAEDLVTMNQLSHTGSDGSEPIDRISRFCRKKFGKSGENISTQFKLEGRNYAENTILWLVIDDGVSDRGHRNSVFDKEFKFYGSATRTNGDKIITVITYLSENWAAI